MATCFLGNFHLTELINNINTTSNSVPNQSHLSVATPVSISAQSKEHVSVSPVREQGDQGVPLDLSVISPSSFHNAKSPISVT